MTRAEEYTTFKHFPIPPQPEGSDFPIHIYTYRGEDGKTAHKRYITQGLSALTVGAAAGIASITPGWKPPEQWIQAGLVGVFIGATLSAAALLVHRKKTVTAQQLIYFDENKLIVDGFNGRPEAFEVSKCRVDLLDLTRGGKEGGQFLRLKEGTKRTYLGAFLDPYELPDLKRAIDQGLAAYPGHHYERAQQQRRPRPPSPKPGDYA